MKRNEINYHDHAKYISTQECSKLTLENFSERLAQANVASKNDIDDFDDRLKNSNKKVNSNKTKYVLVENKLNELTGKVKLLST